LDTGLHKCMANSVGYRAT